MFLSHVLYHIVSSFDLRKILPHGMYHSVTCFLISEEEFSVFWIISTLVAVMNLTAVCVHLYAHVGFYTTTIPGMIVTLDHSFMCEITNMGKKTSNQVLHYVVPLLLIIKSIIRSFYKV